MTSEHQHSCVLVRLRGLDSTGRRDERQSFGMHHEDGCSEFSTSGVLISPSLVLASGALLSPFLSEDRDSFSPDVLTECVVMSAHQKQVALRLNFVCFVEPSDLDSAVRRLVSSEKSMWQIGWAIAHRQELASIQRSLLSTPSSAPGRRAHVVRKTQKLNVPRTSFSGAGRVPLGLLALLQFADPHARLPGCFTPAKFRTTPAVVGEDVRLVGSPYGCLAPHMFFNSVSTGIVANCIGSEGLILDARCLPGSEGGGVFDSNGLLLGVLTAPISRTDNLPLDLQFCVTATALQHVLPEALSSPPPLLPAPAMPNDCSKFLDGVVLVRVNSNRWATGIALDTSRRHIATSAHLFWGCLDVTSPYGGDASSSSPSSSSETHIDLAARFRAQGHRIQVRSGSTAMQWLGAQVDFISPSYVDIAIIHLDFDPSAPPPLIENWKSRRPSEFRTSRLHLGSSVVVSGFGLFGPQSQLPATLTRGRIAKLVALQNDSHVIAQTTAVVHQGNSGGPVFDEESGQIVGIVTCNTRQRDDTIIPTLNFSFLCSTLDPLLSFVKNNGENLSDLHEWLSEDPSAAEFLWKWRGQASTAIDTISTFEAIESIRSRL